MSKMHHFFRQFGQFRVKTYFLASVQRNDHFLGSTIIVKSTVVVKDVFLCV